MDTHGIEKVEAFIDVFLVLKTYWMLTFSLGSQIMMALSSGHDETHDELDGHSDALKIIFEIKSEI